MFNVLGFFGGLGGWEILLILMVLLIFFGAKRIPELARGLGKGIREFKDATKEIKNEIEEGVKEDPKPPKEENKTSS
ncbi:MAG TPA: twin-arginine translocase TatA/TatE family subunit [Cyclobacteriaceae bacterium]|jgi:sec-independent protein translocase protein TatA